MTETSYLIFVQCSLGLESVLSRELSAFGLQSAPREGGVELRGSWADLVGISLSCRTAESVRIRLKHFVARDFSRLERELKKLPFRAYLRLGAPVVIKVTCHQSKLWHSDAVAQRARQVLTEHVGCTAVESDYDGPDLQTVYLRLEEDEVQVSIDAGGGRMHQRGYRSRVESASLRETLAYALWDCAAQETAEQQAVAQVSSPSYIWDPFCGAGTIGLEVAHVQSGRLSGERRILALEAWRSHDPERLIALKGELLERNRASRSAAIQPAATVLCSDISARAVHSAQENAKNADLGGLEFAEGDILEVAKRVPEGAVIVCNPPYGKRLSDCEGVRRLVQLVAKRRDLRPAVALVGGAAKDLIPSSWPAALRFKNGGISVSARVLRSVGHSMGSLPTK